MGKVVKLGPTGKFPRGKLNNIDKGELHVAVSIKAKNTIVIELGTPCTWIGMDADQALRFAAGIKEKAEFCKAQNKG